MKFTGLGTKFNKGFRDMKKSFDLPLEKEIKWSYHWSLQKYQKNSRTIPENQPFYFLKDIDHNEVINFLDSSLRLRSDINGKIPGFGIMEVPTNDDVRTHIREKLNV